MTNILITGANGFIGYHLCRHLSSQDDVKIYGIDLSEQKWNHSAFEYTKVDIRDKDFEKMLPVNIHVIVHLAQSPRYREFPEGAEDMLNVNVNGTFRLLEWARKSGVQKFIFASTGNVYAPAKEPVTELHPCRPGSFYAASKLCAEQIAEQYSKFFKVVILRLFGVYGPGQQNMLVPNMIEKVAGGGEISLAKGKGIYITPLYIDDCVMMILKATEREAMGNSHVIFNLCGNETVDLGHIVENISVFLKKKPVLKLTNNYPEFFLGDNSKFVRLSGFSPATNISEGLRKTMESSR